MVKIKYYGADFLGELQPSAEIEEIGWLTSNDLKKTSANGKLSLEWLKKQNLID
jgi:8-oxo-dGTP diphosphatase